MEVEKLHLPPLISDLGLILLIAGFVTLVFKRIGQPVVLGYLLAGFLVGPEVNFLPTVQERDAIKIWAEIGVIVLLFALGLEFSFKKLMAVGRGASITAATEILLMFAAGFLTGQAFGWNNVDSLFLGGIISISSTTIILRAVEELGFRQRGFVQLVYGVLIVEDLFAILLLVVLPTIALTQTFEGQQLASAVVKLGFFLSIWFVAGIFLVPQFLRASRKFLNDETVLVVSLGLCFLMVTLATKAGFSAALGAFIMGSILAETHDGERIEHILTPIKNLFSAIFFVSVGMLIQIEPLKEHWLAILTISGVLIVGKTLGVSIGAIIGGQSVKTAVQTGVTHTQIGEFSFIIATLGLSLNVISDFIYPIAVSVSALTTLTTPYMIRAGEPFADWICGKLPSAFKNRAQGDLKSQNLTEKETNFRGDWIRLFLNTVLVIAIGIVAKVFLLPALNERLGEGIWPTLISITVSIACALPFLWAVVSGASIMKAKGYGIEAIRELTTEALFVLAARILMAHLLLAFIISQFVFAVWSFALVAFIAIGVGYFGSRNFSVIYVWLERRFLSNLNEKQIAASKKAEIPQLAPWDAHLTRIQVNPDSPLVAKRLSEIGVRERFGVTVAMIERGKKKVLAPRRDEFLMAFDNLIVIGTDEQLTRFANVAESPDETELNSQGEKLASGGSEGDNEFATTSYQLLSISLKPKNQWIGKSIRDSGIREACDGLVVGLERSGQRILNPDATTVLQAGDDLWLVGDPQKIEILQA